MKEILIWKRNPHINIFPNKWDKKHSKLRSSKFNVLVWLKFKNKISHLSYASGNLRFRTITSAWYREWKREGGGRGWQEFTKTPGPLSPDLGPNEIIQNLLSPALGIRRVREGWTTLNPHFPTEKQTSKMLAQFVNTHRGGRMYYMPHIQRTTELQMSYYVSMFQLSWRLLYG